MLWLFHFLSPPSGKGNVDLACQFLWYAPCHVEVISDSRLPIGVVGVLGGTWANKGFEETMEFRQIGGAAQAQLVWLACAPPLVSHHAKRAEVDIRVGKGKGRTYGNQTLILPVGTDRKNYNHTAVAVLHLRDEVNEGKEKARSLNYGFRFKAVYRHNKTNIAIFVEPPEGRLNTYG